MAPLSVDPDALQKVVGGSIGATNYLKLQTAIGKNYNEA